MPDGLGLASTLTMAHLFRSAAHRHPGGEALVADGVRLTFRELDERTDRLAAALLARGIGSGAVVGTLLLDGLAMVELLIATAKTGATVLTMNWRLTAAELQYIIGDADPRILVVSDSFHGLATTAAPSCEIVTVPDGDSDGLCTAFPVGAQSAVLPEVRPEDRWLMLYTSGTTGRPKGCQHSQSGYFVNALAGAHGVGFTSADRGLLTQPLFHVGGLHLFLSLYAAGACTVIPVRGLAPDALLDLVAAEGVTFQAIPILGANEYLAEQRRRPRRHKLRLMLGGGSMTRPELIREFHDVFGIELVLGYGQSEGGGFMAFMSGHDQIERPTAFGKPTLPLVMWIQDDEGNEVADGQPGELVVQGSTLTMGYLGLPEATRDLFAGGVLHTGDICWRDADGYIHFGGRKKELVKSGGENVYPAEVEEVLNGHPMIAESCIVGVRDARWGEAVKALVVLADGASLSPREVSEWCRERIAGYKRPRYVEFVDGLTRDFQGKVRRVEMAARPVTEDQIVE